LSDCAPAGLTDDVRDGAEGTDRGQPQDHGEHLEHQLLDRLDTAQNALTGSTHALHRKADEKRNEQRLKHVALRQRREQ
jgi:hypothetical protein